MAITPRHARFWLCSTDPQSCSFVTCMGVGAMVLFAVSRWGLVRDALK